MRRIESYRAIFSTGNLIFMNGKLIKVELKDCNIHCWQEKFFAKIVLMTYSRRKTGENGREMNRNKGHNSSINGIATGSESWNQSNM